MLISIGLGVLAIAAGAPDAGAALIAGSQAIRDGELRALHAGAGNRRRPSRRNYLEATGQSGRGLIASSTTNAPVRIQTRRAPPWMMTHPYSSDRVESLRQRVERARIATRSKREDNLRRFRFMQAKLIGFIRTAGPDAGALSARATPRSPRATRAPSPIIAPPSSTRRARELDVLIAEEPQQSRTSRN